MMNEDKQSDDAIWGTVVVLNINACGMTCRTLDALRQQSIIERLRIIIVDNASTDGSSEIFSSKYPEMLLIRNKTNLGFSGGNNSAFPYCQGEYVLLLNNDAIPDPFWAEELIGAVRKYPEAGMCTSRIYAGEGRKQYDNTGLLIFIDGLGKSRGHMENDRGQYDNEEEVLMASGCASLYLREPLLKLGGFDEDFFAYCEDTELGLKFRSLGYTCRYVPAAVVHHYQSYTMGKISLKKIFLIERNRIWVLLKLMPLSWILKSPLFTALRLLKSGDAAVHGTGLAGELGHTHSLFRIGFTILAAWFKAFLRLPAMIARRKALRKIRILDDKTWKKLLLSYIATINDVAFSR